jgi:hypothetical protein
MKKHKEIILETTDIYTCIYNKNCLATPYTHIYIFMVTQQRQKNTFGTTGIVNIVGSDVCFKRNTRMKNVCYWFAFSMCE